VDFLMAFFLGWLDNLKPQNAPVNAIHHVFE
jgi:hypothetical protein